MKKEWILLLLLVPLSFLLFFLPTKEERQKKITINDTFRTLLGSQTQYWNYMSEEGMFNDIELFEAVYEKNKRIQFEAGQDFKIPKVIHFIWLGPKNFPRESIENVRSWAAYHPDWTIKFWTDRQRIAPVPQMEVHHVEDFPFLQLKKEFHEAKNWAEKSDILRYEILYQEGGVYVDHDAGCLKAFHNLHRGYDFYACLELPHPAFDDHVITAGIGIIGARPAHPILERSIQLVHHRWTKVTEKFRMDDPDTRKDRVIHRTYMALTYALKKNLDLPGNTDIVFPASYFYGKGNLPTLYSTHGYGSSWHEGTQTPEWLAKRIDALRVKHRMLFRLVSILLIFVLVAAVLLLKGPRSLLLLFLCLTFTACEEAKPDFEAEMEAFPGIEAQRDLQTLELYRALFCNNVALIPQSKPIPSILHFIWLGPRALDKWQIHNLSTWIFENPEFTVKLWTDRPRKAPLPGIEMCDINEYAFELLTHCYQEANTYREKADIARFEILYREGGVAIDMPYCARRTIAPLVGSYDFFAAVHLPYLPTTMQQITVCPDLMGAQKNHPILKKTMENILRAWDPVGASFPQENKEALIYRTSHRIFLPLHEALAEDLPKSKLRNIILPNTYFTEKYATTELNWLDGSSKYERTVRRHLDNLIMRDRQLIVVVSLLILINILLIIKLCFPMKNSQD